jgi:hypothetical protein
VKKKLLRAMKWIGQQLEFVFLVILSEVTTAFCLKICKVGPLARIPKII